MGFLLGLIHFIVGAIAFFCTYMFINSVISSIVSGPAIFIDKDQPDTTLRDAGWRIIFAAVASVCWSILLLM